VAARIIDGKSLAKNLTDEIKKNINNTKLKRQPGLATVLVGNNYASHVYVTNKRRKAEEVGIKSFHFALDETVTQIEIVSLITELNHDNAIDGILVQLPLPKHIDEKKIIETIDAHKDVDGFHPLNLGYLLRGDPKTVACTPLGIMYVIESVKYELTGKHAVVIGRSNIVGKPLLHLLLQKNATVTICHSQTKNLAGITSQADLVVAAVGKAHMINKSHIKEGAFVIDVGINRDKNGLLCGDVNFFDVLDMASFITPVPKGIGPLTIAMLLKNTLANFERMRS
jgi:methylenetetrahydrofolate dehydrogenase (NADP+) / methenyltetrahydrofolate cyclohydrolase